MLPLHPEINQKQREINFEKIRYGLRHNIRYMPGKILQVILGYFPAHSMRWRMPVQRKGTVYNYMPWMREMITLPGSHGRFFRITHECPNGMRAENFRMSGKYHLLYKVPKNWSMSFMHPRTTLRGFLYYSPLINRFVPFCCCSFERARRMY